MTRIFSNKNNSLEVNFVRPRPSPRLAGWLLLALALAFAGDAGLSYMKAHKARVEKQQRAAGFARAAGLPTDLALASRAASPEELAVAAETVQRLSIAWDRLLGALEAAASDKVTLTAIEPDPKTRTVTLTGEGRDYDATLAYVQRLRDTGALERVHLVRHEQHRDDPKKPVAFTVAAAWKESR